MRRDFFRNPKGTISKALISHIAIWLLLNIERSSQDSSLPYRVMAPLQLRLIFSQPLFKIWVKTESNRTRDGLF